MNAPSEDVKDILEGITSLALTFTTDLFVSEMPAEPDGCVCVYDTGGDPPQPDNVYKKPSVQVRVRGAKGGYLIAHALAQSIQDVLHGTANYTINGARYIGIWAVGDVLFVGYDDNHRPLLTANFRLHRTNA